MKKLSKTTSKKSRSKKSQSKKIVEPTLKRADLMMKTSDLELIAKTLAKFNIDEVRVEKFSDGYDFNAIHFDFNSTGSLIFYTGVGEKGGVASMFLRETYGDNNEDLLEESRPLKIYIDEFGE